MLKLRKSHTKVKCHKGERMKRRRIREMKNENRDENENEDEGDTKKSASPTYVEIEVVAQISHRIAIWYSAATSGDAPPNN